MIVCGLNDNESRCRKQFRQSSTNFGASFQILTCSSVSALLYQASFEYSMYKVFAETWRFCIRTIRTINSTNQRHRSRKLDNMKSAVTMRINHDINSSFKGDLKVNPDGSCEVCDAGIIYISCEGVCSNCGHVNSPPEWIVRTTLQIWAYSK